MNIRNNAAVVTIKDIARTLGLAHTTVSRALNHHPRISEETKQRVQETAKRLGYIANSGARSMRGGSTKLVGLIVPDTQNEFYNAAARAMAEQCEKHGYQLMLCTSEDDPVREERHVLALREHRAAGVLISPTAAPTAETAQLLKAMHAVQFLRIHKRLGRLCVHADDRAALFNCTQHLISLGHQHIGFIGASVELSTGSERFDGFRTALAASGVEFLPQLAAFGPVRPEFGQAAFEQIYAQEPTPTAIVVSSSRLMLGVLQAVQLRGLDIPSRLSLVAYGDADWFSVSRPQITAVGLPIDHMGQTATRLLFSRIAPQFSSERLKQHHIFSTELIERESTSKPLSDPQRLPGIGP